MIINHNIPALVTNNALRKANTATDKASKKLSTGLRINTAADDAAGLAIANKMKTQSKGLEMADRNCNDAISLIQTAEGGMSEIQNMLQRMRELAIQGANDTLTDDDRLKIQEEVNQLIDEVDSTAEKIQFNTKSLLDGTNGSFTFQVGPNAGLEITVDMVNLKAAQIGYTPSNYKMDISTGDALEGEYEEAEAEEVDEESIVKTNDELPLKGMSLLDLRTPVASEEEEAEEGETATGKYSTRDGCAKDCVRVCDGAISSISTFRAKLGAIQNRLEYTSSAIGVSNENVKTALSRIQDTDMAAEMTEYTKDNVIVQSSISMLAQANQRPNQLLSLLQ